MSRVRVSSRSPVSRPGERLCDGTGRAGLHAWLLPPTAARSTLGLMVATVPQTHYATAPDGVSIAYQVVGDGPRDLVWGPGWRSHVDAGVERPTPAPVLRRLPP